MEDLHYRCSFVINETPENFLKSEIEETRVVKKCAENMLKDKDGNFVKMEGNPYFSHFMYSGVLISEECEKLLSEDKTNQVILLADDEGEIDLELKDKPYLHVFDKITKEESDDVVEGCYKPSRMKNTIQDYKDRYDMKKIVLPDKEPLPWEPHRKIVKKVYKELGIPVEA